MQAQKCTNGGLNKSSWTAMLVGLGMLTIAQPAALAQGCVLVRTPTAANPMLEGSQSGGYLQPGEWQLDFSFRDSTATEHYNLDERQWLRDLYHNNVTNTQRIYDLGSTYAFSDRFSVNLGIPFVNSHWDINDRPFANPNLPGPDVLDLHGVGIGDISVLGRFWLGEPSRHPVENAALGFGVKFPTGAYDETSYAPDISGKNWMQRAVDTSAQPGDGGYGLIFDFLGFKQIDKSTLTLNATYLASLRDTNGTPSIIAALGTPFNPSNADLLVNGVPDTYFARAAWLYPFGKSGLTLSIAYRIEGSPRFNLFTANDGFRRPGYETFFEPGFVYSHGPHTLSFNIPIAHERYRDLNSTADPVTGAFDRGDATFPDYMVLVNYSYRFGGKHHQSAPQASACSSAKCAPPADTTEKQSAPLFPPPTTYPTHF